MEIEDLIEKSKLFYKLESDESFLFKELNNLNDEKIKELENELSLGKKFGSVKLLRYIILSELKKKNEIDEKIIDEIKRDIEDRDVSKYVDLPEEYQEKLTSYPRKGKGMFPNWKNPFNILYVFFNDKKEKNEINKLLESYGKHIIDKYELKNVKTVTSNGFLGSKHYGTSELYSVVIDDSFKNIRDAYQIVFRLVDGKIEGGIHKGDSIKEDYNREHDKYNNWDDFINGIGSVVDEWKDLNKKLLAKKYTNENKTDKYNSDSEMKTPLNQILYGPPGTGKTYNTINKSISIANPDFDLKQDRKIIKKEYDRLVGEGQIVFTTFHQSMSYEDFVEGIKPKTDDNVGVTYEIENGIFKSICSKSLSKTENNYVLIIDEINRGNISSIFGELITLIEEDKRLGKEEELKVTLPYSKEGFGVPSNLYIIGTMNTADRSVEALDTALRRRFSFDEMPPMPEVLINEHSTNGIIIVGEERISLVDILKTINQRIEILLDRDHLIGHSFFINVTTEDDLRKTFAKNILPLLQEHFYGDYGKIALVLGEEFCKAEETHTSNIFANVADYDTSVFEDKPIYRIKDVEKESFDILKAINVLLNLKTVNSEQY